MSAKIAALSEVPRAIQFSSPMRTSGWKHSVGTVHLLLTMHHPRLVPCRAEEAVEDMEVHKIS